MMRALDGQVGGTGLLKVVGWEGRKDRYPPSSRRSFNECPSHLLVCGGAPQTLLKWGRFPNPEEFMPREVKPEACTAGATSP
jgi:hypothetical protein